MCYTTAELQICKKQIKVGSMKKYSKLRYPEFKHSRYEATYVGNVANLQCWEDLGHSSLAGAA